MSEVTQSNSPQSTLSSRQEQLLRTVVEEYVSSAKPVGSKYLADQNSFGVSSATIRNELKALEDLGFITHPHTSAGRVPTAQGYTYYVEHFIDTRSSLYAKAAAELEKLSAIDAEPEVRVKTIAKGLAELSSDAVLVRLRRNNFYYTGISNIFSKPEFSDASVMYSITQLMDHLDDVLTAMTLQEEIDILIGDANPVSQFCSSIATSYEMDGDRGILVILGPMRMRYQHNYNLLKHTKTLI